MDAHTRDAILRKLAEPENRDSVYAAAMRRSAEIQSGIADARTPEDILEVLAAANARAERAQVVAQQNAKAAHERMDDLRDVAAQLRDEGLNLWRVCEVSEDGEEVLTPGRIPIFVAYSAREAIELWRKKVNPPGGVVWLYVSESMDGPEALRILQARLKFVRGRWYCSTRMVKS